jgi:hypothetical protein
MNAPVSSQTADRCNSSPGEPVTEQNSAAAKGGKMVERTELPEGLERVQSCVESSTNPSSISKAKELYERILMLWRDEKPASNPLNRSFDFSGEDQILLAYHVALGMSAGDVRKLWTPEISAKNFAKHLYQATGFNRIVPFRAQFLAELEKSLLRDVRTLVSKKARLLAKCTSELSDDEIERLSDDVYICFNNQNKGGILSRLFQLNPDSAPNFSYKVLLASKNEFLKILLESPLSKFWDYKTIPLIELRCKGVALQECSHRYQISKERVSQLVDQAETIHPLIRSIIRARVAASGKPTITKETAPELVSLIEELTEYVVINPTEAFTSGTLSDSSRNVLKGEEMREALKRMFLAGWAGKYGTTFGANPCPGWFSSFRERTPYIFFVKLARQAARLYIKKVAESEVIIDQGVVIQKLKSDSELTNLDVDTVSRYLKVLVLDHRASMAAAWRVANEEHSDFKSKSFPSGLVKLFDSYIRETAKDRAAEAFKVFSEQWAIRWATTPGMENLIAARVRDQLSLQETAKKHRWSSSYVSTMQERMLTTFPELAAFLPRKDLGLGTGLLFLG